MIPKDEAPSGFADFERLRELSGYKRQSDVRKWLTKNGVMFMVGKNGKPMTTREHINIGMHGHNKKLTEPDFSPPPGYKPRGKKPANAPDNGTRVIAITKNIK